MSLTYPSVQDLYNAFKSEVLSRDPTLTYWAEGGNLDALGGASAVVGDETLGYAARLHRALYLATAVGGELDALGVDRYNLPRLGTAKAVGYVNWIEGSASGYPIPAGTTVRGTLDDGSTFDAVTVEDALSDSGLPVLVEAVTAGREGNVPAGTLVNVVGLGADATATVEQVERLAGGAAAESDTAYAARLRTFWQSLSLGTRSAYDRVVRSTAGVSFSLIEEVQTVDALLVRIYVADAEGSGNGALVARVLAAADQVRALGVRLDVIAAEREEVAVEIALRLRPGVDYLSVLSAVSAALIVFFDNLPAGTPVYRSQVAEICHRAHQDVLSANLSVDVITPTESYNSLRLLGGAPTLTVV